MSPRLLAALLAAAPLAAPAGERAPAGGAKDKLRLIVDYLPAFMYRGEKLACSFRVERGPGLAAKPAFKISWSFADGKGKGLKSGEEERRAEKRFTIVRGFLPVPAGARRLKFALESGGKTIAGGSARLVGEGESWPEGARAAWGGMVSAGGERLILTLEERIAKVDDRWKPVRLLWKLVRPGARNVLLAGPRLAPEKGESYQGLLAGGKLKVKVIKLPPPPRREKREGRPAQGIYRLLELVESEVAPAAKGVDLVVVVAPPEDPEMATEPRRYRQGLDWILARLRRAGARRLALVPPVTKKVPAKQLAAYTQLCEKAAAVYKARFLNTAALLKPACWKPEGAEGKVTGRYPNARGRKVLAGLIRAACR